MRSKCAPVECATTSASVVFPLPGGPHRMIEGSGVALDRHAQRAAWPEYGFLSDKLVQR